MNRKGQTLALILISIGFMSLIITAIISVAKSDLLEKPQKKAEPVKEILISGEDQNLKEHVEQLRAERKKRESNAAKSDREKGDTKR